MTYASKSESQVIDTFANTRTAPVSSDRYPDAGLLPMLTYNTPVSSEPYLCQHSGPCLLYHGIGLFWCKEDDIWPITHRTTELWLSRSIFYGLHTVDTSCN